MGIGLVTSFKGVFPEDTPLSTSFAIFLRL